MNAPRAEARRAQGGESFCLWVFCKHQHGQLVARRRARPQAVSGTCIQDFLHFPRKQITPTTLTQLEERQTAVRETLGGSIPRYSSAFQIPKKRLSADTAHLR